MFLGSRRCVAAALSILLLTNSKQCPLQILRVDERDRARGSAIQKISICETRDAIKTMTSSWSSVMRQFCCCRISSRVRFPIFLTPHNPRFRHSSDRTKYQCNWKNHARTLCNIPMQVKTNNKPSLFSQHSNTSVLEHNEAQTCKPCHRPLRL